MASHNITVTYPDGQGARIMAALKAAATGTLPKNPDGSDPVPTNAQALAWFTSCVKANLRDIVLRYEREQAIKAVTAPDVT